MAIRSRLQCTAAAAAILTFLLYRTLSADFTIDFTQHAQVQVISPPQQQPQLSTSIVGASEAEAAAQSHVNASIKRSLPQDATTAAYSLPPLRQQAAVEAPPTAAELPAWMRPESSALAFNSHAQAQLARVTPRGTTMHFTFGSSVMMDFVKNWLYFVRRAKLQPLLIGAADLPLLKACNELGVPAAGIIPELDVWTYQRTKQPTKELYEMRSEWKYFRHHNSDFLEMGLVKVCMHSAPRTTSCALRLGGLCPARSASHSAPCLAHLAPPCAPRPFSHRWLASGGCRRWVSTLTLTLTLNVTLTLTLPIITGGVPLGTADHRFRCPHL